MKKEIFLSPQFFLFAAVILSISASPVYPAPILSDEQDKEYAKACYDNAKLTFEDDLDEASIAIREIIARDKRTGARHGDATFQFGPYSRWPSKITEITKSGANIRTQIRIKNSYTTDSNGWGETVAYSEVLIFSCYFRGMAKTEHPNMPDMMTKWSSIQDKDRRPASCYLRDLRRTKYERDSGSLTGERGLRLYEAEELAAKGNFLKIRKMHEFTNRWDPVNNVGIATSHPLCIENREADWWRYLD